jgi:Pyridoxamine 5'-phosphate oxidase
VAPGPEIGFFLGTVRPDGRPHAAGVGALWEDGACTHQWAGTRKARNLAATPPCTISVKLEGIDLVLEGEATRVTDGPTPAHRVRSGHCRAVRGHPLALRVAVNGDVSLRR